jgi:hypothetical protein
MGLRGVDLFAKFLEDKIHFLEHRHYSESALVFQHQALAPVPNDRCHNMPDRYLGRKGMFERVS